MKRKRFRQSNHEYMTERVQTNSGDTGITTSSTEESGRASYQKLLMI